MPHHALDRRADKDVPQQVAAVRAQHDEVRRLGLSGADDPVEGIARFHQHPRRGIPRRLRQFRSPPMQEGQGFPPFDFHQARGLVVVHNVQQ